MGRRRRGRRGSGRPKPAGPQTGQAPAKSEPSSAKPAPSRPSGRQRQPPPSKGERIAEWIGNFPPAAEKLPEFLGVCIELGASPAIREEVSLSEEELFYWLASGVETLAEEELDKLFEEKYRGPLAEIRARHELEENKYWKPDDPAIPEEYRNLLDEFRAEKRAVLAKTFEKYRAPETADLVRNDYSSYLSKREEGKSQFFARDPLESMRLPAEIKAMMEAELSA